MNKDIIINLINSQNSISWVIILTTLVLILPVLWVFSKWLIYVLQKTKVTPEVIEYEDEEDIEIYQEEGYEDENLEDLGDKLPEDDNIIEIEETITIQDPDESTREHLYRERLWSEVEYNRRKSKRDDYEKKLIEGLSHDQHNHDIIKTLAEYYFNSGQTKKALPLLKKIVDQYPDDHKTLRQIAEIYLESGDFETSELLTNKALSLSGETPKYAITLTEIYYHTGRVDEAIRTMENVVKRRPSRIAYREALIKLYEEAGEYELAIQCCQSILEIDNTNIKAKKKALELRNKL